LPGCPLDVSGTTAFLRRYPDGLSDEDHDRLLRASGIATRHFAIDPDDESSRESNASMAAAAGRQALEAAGWRPEEIDLLVVTTVVPDQLMPPTSTLVQALLGIPSCTELEISANCTAPTKALMVACGQIQAGVVRRVLVCSSQFASFGFFPPWLNPEVVSGEQAHLRWILSDGAGAVALEAGEPDIQLRTYVDSCGTKLDPGMVVRIGAAYPDLVGAFASGAQHVTQPRLSALKHGMRLAAAGLECMLRRFELPGAAIDHFIPSVSSVQIADRMKAVFAKLGVRPEAWRTNFERVGYVGSVSIPIVLDELARSGRLRPGDVICTLAEESSKWMFAGSVMRWNP